MKVDGNPLAVNHGRCRALLEERSIQSSLLSIDRKSHCKLVIDRISFPIMSDKAPSDALISLVKTSQKIEDQPGVDAKKP